MKPIETLDVVQTPDGRQVRLTVRDGVYRILVDGLELMTSGAHHSEASLARLGCASLGHVRRPRLLVGGLGMGYTLRAALDLLPRGAVVEVAELLPAVVRWNRGPLAALAGHPLHDPRVRLTEGDVAVVLDAGGARWDAILLDVDNGPLAMTLAANEQLYGKRGLERIYQKLVPGGVLAVWSAFRDAAFERRLKAAGFDVSRESVSSRAGGKGPHHTIFVARTRGARGGFSSLV